MEQQHGLDQMYLKEEAILEVPLQQEEEVMEALQEALQEGVHPPEALQEGVLLKLDPIQEVAEELREELQELQEGEEVWPLKLQKVVQQEVVQDQPVQEEVVQQVQQVNHQCLYQLVEKERKHGDMSNVMLKAMFHVENTVNYFVMMNGEEVVLFFF